MDSGLKTPHLIRQYLVVFYIVARQYHRHTVTFLFQQQAVQNITSIWIKPI
jgi:hypothetical protein